MKQKLEFISAELASAILLAGVIGAVALFGGVALFCNNAEQAAQIQSIEVRAENKHLKSQLFSTELDRDKWREMAEKLSKIDAEQAAQVQKKNDAMQAEEAAWKKMIKENLERQKGKTRTINEVLGIGN